ncbi:MAG: DUF4396 domain-containing protein [Alphaproteobacteria bacterium]
MTTATAPNAPKPTPTKPWAISWRCKHSWKRASKNTAWCLLGCSIGDMGTIWAFSQYAPDAPLALVMVLAIINGILTSIALETYIMSRQMALTLAFKTAVGMSLISMISMEIAMNLVDFWLVGGARLVWWVIPLMLLAGFVTPLPYNYWRLKALGKACH